MKQILNVLLVDDHPSALEGYERCLEMASADFKEKEFKIAKAHDCDSAQLKIREAKNGQPLDLVLLDLSLPPSTDRTLLSGDDVGIKIRRNFKDAKLIVLSHHTDSHRLYNVFSTLNPDGLLIKSDYSYKQLAVAIVDVINDVPHYSKTVGKLIKGYMCNHAILDNINIQMLMYISKGVKMKDIAVILGVSVGCLEKRKRKLRDIFDTPVKNDSLLIERAREIGFI